MDMTENKDHIVEKKIYEDGKKHDYASKGLAGTALGIGIGGLALSVLPWITGGNRSVFGSLGGSNMPENVNINAYGYGMTANSNSPTALQVMEKECADEVKLLTDMFGLKLDTANKFYALRETDIAEKFSMWKGLSDAIGAENRRSMEAEFGLYKNGRDMNDATNAKIAELEKRVAVAEAVRPYQDKLLMAYTDMKTCTCIRGQLVLPNTPAVSGYGSYSGCNCNPTATTPSTGA